MKTLEPWSPHQRETFLSMKRGELGEADLLELTLQVAREGFLRKSKSTYSPDPLFSLIRLIEDLGELDPSSYLGGKAQHVLDLLASEARAQAVRAAAESAGGDPEGSGDPEDFDDACWRPEELELLARCREVAADEGEPGIHPRHLAQLLLIIMRVYARGHSSTCPRLVKSTGLTRAIQLLSSERLFPPMPGGSTIMIAERVRLLSGICLDSPQRPVADAAGLVLLEQDLEESWSTRFPELAPWALEAATNSRERVLSLTELARQLDPPSADPLYERLRTADFKDKRMRLVELASVLDTHGDTPGVEAIAQRALGVVFENLDDTSKGKLIERLFRDLERSNSSSRRGWLKHVLEPIVLQNATNLSVQARLVSLVSTFLPDEREPYLLFHLDAMREVDLAQSDPAAIAFAQEHGSRAFIARLYPLTEVTGFLGRTTSLGRAAREAIEAIVEREGLGATSCSLSVAQGAGGELSVAVARHGALSLGGGGAVVSPAGSAGEGGALDLATDTSIGSTTPVVDFVFKAVVALGILAAIYLASAGVLAALASP